MRLEGAVEMVLTVGVVLTNGKGGPTGLVELSVMLYR